MIKLTLEQAQQIEEALAMHANGCGSIIHTKMAYDTIRVARAQKQAEQEPVMDYERLNALREGEQNVAEDAYFFVRPENDTPTFRKMFCQGFERGFHKGIKYYAPIEPVKQEPVMITPGGGAFPFVEVGYVGEFVAPTESLPAGTPLCVVPAEQAEQEPVGVVETSDEWGVAGVVAAGTPVGTLLYASLVRTKDLTDDEIVDIWNRNFGMVDRCRAVIAAYREKNK